MAGLNKYKAYPEYKDSGVEWLGKVPANWKITTLKNIATIVNGSTPKSGVEDYWDGDINWITPTDLSQKSCIYLNESQRKITLQGLNSCGTTLVPANTVILSTRAPIGSLAITGTSSCTNQGCKSLVIKSKEISLFIYYYFSISTSPLNNLGRGSTFLELSSEDLGSFRLPLPDADIGKITAFLEHETAKIDKLIEKQQQLIELLKEKRQAVISYAVTKGLNPDVPMKDSGVEWLGEVPKHWVVSGFKKYLASIVDYRGKTPNKIDDGILLVTARNIKKGMLDYTLSEEFIASSDYKEVMSRGVPNIGDVLFTTEAPLGEVANVDRTDIALAQRIIKFNGMASFLDNYYFKYFIMSSAFQQSLNLVTYSSRCFSRIMRVNT
ncbi:restriction endonuclease subunit S [Xenorhabdus bovienii]|uniref:restriction endonuclease subunit S n=1 Tax=Xenorhabdus bovienii TaxID=40576 RepID=UPI0004D39B81|nr:restriction endonuclease subunit S [Xenorhabdus bovienii]CDG86935.1 Type I restriction modification DNA specificity domain protein [Xenorhabdus bovienii str. feltiae France]CDG94469.1 Type I restriction modification DNA specificity domain protein [Xenorhabdus bovienii str. feltiae Florida]